MRKILAFCLLCNFVFGDTHVYEGDWKSVKINDKEIICNGKKDFIGSKISDKREVKDEKIAYCLKNDKILWYVINFTSTNLDTNITKQIHNVFAKDCETVDICKERLILDESDTVVIEINTNTLF